MDGVVVSWPGAAEARPQYIAGTGPELDCTTLRATCQALAQDARRVLSRTCCLHPGGACPDREQLLQRITRFQLEIDGLVRGNLHQWADSLRRLVEADLPVDSLPRRAQASY